MSAPRRIVPVAVHVEVAPQLHAMRDALVAMAARLSQNGADAKCVDAALKAYRSVDELRSKLDDRWYRERHVGDWGEVSPYYRRDSLEA